MSTPPASGPIATAAPIVAPQMPNAVPRSRPWNSCESSASEVANMIAPPTPCTPAPTIRKSADVEIPHSEGGDGEEGEPDDEDPLAAEQVGERAGGEHAGREREGVRVDDPLQLGERRIEVLLHRRQGDVHDRDVEQEHENRRADGDQRPPLRSITGTARRLLGGILTRMQDVLDVSNDVAAELAGIGDGVLDALRERLHCIVRLRGNQLTLEGDEQHVAEARAVVDELVELVEGGHQIGPDTVDAVLGALDQAEDIREVFDDVVWRHRGKKIAPKTVTQKRYVDAIRDRTITFGIGPAGTGKTYLAVALAVQALQAKRGGPHHPHPARGRGRRAARLPARRPAGEGRPVPAAALRRALRHARRPTGVAARAWSAARSRSRRSRSCAAARSTTRFIILDEAQNTTPEQMKMFLTRLGFGSKVVVTGDVTQIDLPREQALRADPGARHPRRRSTGSRSSSSTHEDVVRHKLVQHIVEAYKRHAEETGTARKR